LVSSTVVTEHLKPLFPKDEGWWVGHDAVLVTLSHTALDVQGLSCVL